MKVLTTRAIFILLITLLPLAVSSVSAQEGSGPTNPPLILEPGVTPHKGIDSIYTRFHKAYKDLDIDAVADLYTDSAAYLSPGKGLQIGHDKVVENFTQAFQIVKERKLKWLIAFRIFQRSTEKDLGYDVGIFTLITVFPDGTSRTDRGKFVAVTKRGNDGKWRFQVDGYSELPAQDK